MQFLISTDPDQLKFSATEDESVLEAALAAGLLLPHGCRDGACGACKARIVHGEIEQGEVADSALSDAERAAGYALLCKARARSDLVIKVRGVSRGGDIAPQKMPCRVQDMRRLADDVMMVTAKLPASHNFRFHPGQYIDVLLPDGRRRSFSIANAPHDNDHLELHIRRVPNGYFTGQVFNELKARDILRIEGPLGSFFLREERDRPIVLLAGGTGFAPIKSIVEHVIATGIERDLMLYWGARMREGLYMHELGCSWEKTLRGFRYVPVLSEATASDAWTGRCGLVHEALMADIPDLSGHDVYACGAPAMIEAARHELSTRCNLAPDAFFADAFTFALDSHV
ncbi:MAG: CDP-6-deoxy-delta-3,4-glucoseen reductase [Rhodocyclales bacterium]|nr:CDP-6-deoxy-delta-3,4-glucoseen reductase [Rhodocyclales bacterium]